MNKSNPAAIFQDVLLDEYFRGKMEEYILSLESHSDYYDNGLILTMKNKLTVNLIKLKHLESRSFFFVENSNGRRKGGHGVRGYSPQESRGSCVLIG